MDGGYECPPDQPDEPCQPDDYSSHGRWGETHDDRSSNGFWGKTQNYSGYLVNHRPSYGHAEPSHHKPPSRNAEKVSIICNKYFPHDTTIVNDSTTAVPTRYAQPDPKLLGEHCKAWQEGQPEEVTPIIGENEQPFSSDVNACEFYRQTKREPDVPSTSKQEPVTSTAPSTPQFDETEMENSLYETVSPQFHEFVHSLSTPGWFSKPKTKTKNKKKYKAWKKAQVELMTERLSTRNINYTQAKKIAAKAVDRVLNDNKNEVKGKLSRHSLCCF